MMVYIRKWKIDSKGLSIKFQYANSNRYEYIVLFQMN